MKNKASLTNKIYRKIHWIIFSKIKPGAWIRNCYPAYRHGIRYAKKNVGLTEENSTTSASGTVYFTQVPNEGAGIGHQMANYIGGYHYSEIYGVPHAYSGFKDKIWDNFFGFGEGEVTVQELKKQGYKLRRIPYFDEVKDAKLIQNIIASYQGKKIILQTELDQFYQKQYEVIPHIKKKFEDATARKQEPKLYDSSKINIAVHIRRGDIVAGQTTGEETLTKRWLTNDYYENVVSNLCKVIKEGQLDNLGIPRDKEIVLYLFSQGDPKDYQVYEKYASVKYCLDKDAMQSFLMMVRADILVTSKSSFSYKPALLSDGIRICPPEFWHGYPEDANWIVARKDGTLPSLGEQ